MSLFNGTLQRYVQNQIIVRQNAKSALQTNATNENLIYHHAKTTWVRFSSNVNTPNGNGQSTNLDASRYVLEGGTLYPRGNTHALRAGLGTADPRRPNTVDGAYIPGENGLRPMPGITAVSVINKGAFGSLRHATVSFNCWNMKDLETLEMLFMRPGFTCLLEWGNTQYLNNSGKLVNNNKHIDIINKVQEQNQILVAIDKAREESNGNYDAMFGYVQNFRWSFRPGPDGGYDCTAELISLGSLLESLKLNYVSGTANSDTNGRSVFHFGTASGATATHLDNFYKRGKIIGILREIMAPLYLSDKNYQINEIGKKYLKQIHQVRQLHFEQNQYVDKHTNHANKGRGMYYMTLETIVELINDYVVVRNKKTGTKLTTLSTKDKQGNNIKCATHKVQTSVDPFKCIVLDTASEHRVNYTIDGNKKVLTIKRPNLMTGRTSEPIKYFYDSNYKTASIGNIYVNLEYFSWLILDNVDPETNGIDIFSGMNKLMKQIQQALGNINNFEIFIDPDDNVGRIIDYAYVDQSQTNGAKFNLSITGLGSTARQGTTVESSITPNTAAMIAIAAQASNTDSTTGLEIDSLIRYNDGLVDRSIPSKSVPEHASTSTGDQTSNKIQQIEKTNNDLNTFAEELSRVNGFNEARVLELIASLKYSVTNLLTIIKKADDDALVKRANNFIIPITLTVVIDGISGLTIGEVFTLPPHQLPKQYRSANVGFIITGITHTLQNNDWNTTITTQTCILN